MKIAFISTFFPPHIYGGAEISTSILIEHLENNVESIVITSKLEENSWQYKNIEVFPVLYQIGLGKRKLSDILLYGFKIVLLPWLNAFVLYSFLKKHSPDLVHIVPSAYSQVGLILTLAILKMPTMIDIRDFTWVCVSDFSYVGAKDEQQHSCFTHIGRMYNAPIYLKPFLNVIALFEVTLFILYTNIIKRVVNQNPRMTLSAVSEYTKQKLVKAGFRSEKIQVISNISSTQRSTDTPRKKTFVFAGRLEKSKGIWQVVEAFHESRLPDFNLEIFGDGPEFSKLKDYISMKKISSIILHGQQTQETVLQAYKTAYAIVSSSIRPEPLGRYVLDSFLTKTPLIANNIGGPAEYITNQVNGLLVQPNDKKQLIEAMLLLAKDKNLHKKISENLENIPKKMKTSFIVNQRFTAYKSLLT